MIVMIVILDYSHENNSDDDCDYFDLRLFT